MERDSSCKADSAPRPPTNVDQSRSKKPPTSHTAGNKASDSILLPTEADNTPPRSRDSSETRSVRTVPTRMSQQPQIETDSKVPSMSPARMYPSQADDDQIPSTSGGPSETGSNKENLEPQPRTARTWTFRPRQQKTIVQRRTKHVRARPQAEDAAAPAPGPQFELPEYLTPYYPAIEKIMADAKIDPDTLLERVRRGRPAWTVKEEEWTEERGTMQMIFILNLSKESPEKVPDVMYVATSTFTRKARVALKKMKEEARSEDCRCNCESPTKCRYCKLKVGAVPANRYLHVKESGHLTTNRMATMMEDLTRDGKALWSIVCDHPDSAHQKACRHVEENFKLSPLFVTMEGEDVGWALRAALEMPVGSVVAFYTGEIREQGEKTKNPESHAFDIGTDFIVDAFKKGNEARFLMHSCEPNCTVAHVYENNRTLSNKYYRLLLITKQVVKAGELLTLDYHAGMNKLERKTRPRNAITCLCRTPKCWGWLQAGSASKKTKK